MKKISRYVYVECYRVTSYKITQLKETLSRKATT